MSNKRQIRLGEDGVRLCDQTDCELIATHTFMWGNEGWVCQCVFHTQQMCALEKHLGYNIANASVRQMTPDEMMPDENEGDPTMYPPRMESN